MTFTLISSGTLVASNVEALGTGDVTDNATLELNTSGTFDNAISGSGQVVKSGDKMLTLSGANSYSGGTLISDGTLVASNVEALGTGDVTSRWSPATLSRWGLATSPTTPRWN
ncbi:autotransporter-associated beta strand repeat-containing protein [Salmonella enterica]|uniref:autotransporter-associated beta strand repeat-containing protein n=1 Tax=Salmonella enterica TaxID=28901 RepID=UPI0003A84986